MSGEAIARVGANARIRSALQRLPPKMLSLRSGASTEVVQAGAVEGRVGSNIQRIEGAMFTSMKDKGSVPALYKEYVQRIAQVLGRMLSLTSNRRPSIADAPLQPGEPDAALRMPAVPPPPLPPPPPRYGQGQLLRLLPDDSGRREGGEGGGIFAIVAGGHVRCPLAAVDAAERAAIPAAAPEYDACSQLVLPWRPPEASGWEAALVADVDGLARLHDRSRSLVARTAALAAEGDRVAESSLDAALFEAEEMLRAVRELPCIARIAAPLEQAILDALALEPLPRRARGLITAIERLSVESLAAAALRGSGCAGARRYAPGQWLTLRRGTGWMDVAVGDAEAQQHSGRALWLHPWNHAPRALPSADAESLRMWDARVMHAQHAHIIDALSHRKLDALRECVQVAVTSVGANAGADGVGGVEDAETLSEWLRAMHARMCDGGPRDKPLAVLLTAPPAAGKTWLMSQLIVHTLGGAGELIPILIKAEQLQRRLLADEAGFAAAWNWIDAYLRVEKPGVHYVFLRQVLMARRALVLLDGLDEAHAAHERIERHVSEVLAPQGHVLLVTSRPAGLHAARFGTWHQMRLKPLSEAQQATALRRRLSEDAVVKLLPYLRERMPIDSETGLKITANPLMLSMVVSIAELHEGIEMPTTTAELYEVAAGTMLARAASKVSAEARDLLQATFVRAHTSEARIITREHVEAAAADDARLVGAKVELYALVERDQLPLVRLLQREPLQMQATHLSFQEFYAMRAVCDGERLLGVTYGQPAFPTATSFDNPASHS